MILTVAQICDMLGLKTPAERVYVNGFLNTYLVANVVKDAGRVKKEPGQTGQPAKLYDVPNYIIEQIAPGATTCTS